VTQLVALVAVSILWGAINGWFERSIRALLLGALGANVIVGIVVVAVWQVALVVVPMSIVLAASATYLSKLAIVVGTVVSVLTFRVFQWLGQRRHAKVVRKAGLIGEDDL
jgi:hypothetical protein